MKWPLLDVQAGSLQSRQALKDARSPSPAHIVVSNLSVTVTPLSGAKNKMPFSFLLMIKTPNCQFFKHVFLETSFGRGPTEELFLSETPLLDHSNGHVEIS